MKIYTIKQGNKTVGLQHRDYHYIIGFESVNHARKVQYNLHHDKPLTLLRTENINLTDKITKLNILNANLIIDTQATLFLPKYIGKPNAINDGCFHLEIETYENFIIYPVTKMIGVILPYNLQDETDDEFLYKSFVVEPSFIPEIFG